MFTVSSFLFSWSGPEVRPHHTTKKEGQLYATPLIALRLPYDCPTDTVCRTALYAAIGALIVCQ